MRGREGSRRGRLRRRALWQFVLLMLPVLFWSAVFASLTAAGPHGPAPDATQVLVALMCALLAAILGFDVLEWLRR